MCCNITAAVLSLAAIGAAIPGSVATAEDRQIGDTTVLARVPDPGQPAGIALDGKSVLVTTMGMATQPVTDPRLFVFDRGSGDLRNSVTIPRMMPATPMALKDVALDSAGRAYVVDMNGRIIRVDPKTGQQHVYVEFPAAVAGMATMPSDLAFDESGAAYVTDQNLSAIWRVPPGGGTPEVWFHDHRLTSYVLGPSGLRFDPATDHLYFTVPTAVAAGGSGLVYRLPVDDPSARRLQELHRYPARSNPFGLALGSSGKLYVALYGTHQVSVLEPSGTEELRFPSAEENAERDIPYNRPVAAAFDGGGSLLITNSAFLSAPDHMVVLDAWVDDVGAPIARPTIPDSPVASRPLPKETP